MPRRAVTALLATAALLGLTACGPASTSTAPTGDGTFPVTLTDAMGQVSIPRQPTRVAALDASYVDAAIALETQVVAYTNYRGITGGLPAYLGAEARTYGRDAQAVGEITSPSLEKIAATRPDLIVSAKVRHEQVHPQLKGIAPTVFSETTGPTWKANIRLLGRALGKSELAERKIKAYEDRARRIGDAVRAKLGKNPTVSVVRFAGEQTVRLYSPSSFSGTVLTDAGFELNATARAVPAGKISADLSQERIADLDADRVFVSTWQDDKGDSAKQKGVFEANPLWGRLTGARQDVDDLTWMTAVGLQGAGVILDEVAKAFGVPAN
ncbi:iron-siderophore ABC transporter substrate-binding protein [Kutzneria viridogrisea]|uniref:Iron complex transport system substrate-binding protein n=1 Tax=Kutzneria viridogrisea TaxID=47990 RepID=A0ABR6BWI1_9PSEU|nr:iron complex transport system substrate-binding protein [Kutzneria viridogrisea]